MSFTEEKIARFTKGLKFASLSKDVIYETKVRIIDSMACAFGAYEADACKIARKVCEMGSGEMSATVIGYKEPTHPLFATYANSVMVRYLDYNDTYLSLEPAHPSDNISACLAAAESFGRSGKDLITAIVVAYEIQCRLCDAACIRCRGWDHTTYGALSTSAAVSKLMGADIVNSIRIATAYSPALRQIRVGELSHAKGSAFAHAAMKGFFAALLAKQGMTGPAPVFEGEKGFENQVSGSLKNLRFTGKLKLPQTYLKFYPAEYHSQASIEAALHLRQQMKKANSIDSVTIDIYDAAIDIIGDSSKWRPQNKETADHSLPFIVATAILYGDITLNSYRKKRYNDKKLLQLMDKIKLRRSSKFEKNYGKTFSNTMTIKLSNGENLAATVHHPKGHPKNPFTKNEVAEKFKRLTYKYFSPQKQRSLLTRLWNIEKEKNLRKFMQQFAIKP